MTTPNRARSQVRHNDVTGRKSEQLKKEAAEELALREGQISTITIEAARSHNEDIIDLETQEVIKPDGTTAPLEEPKSDAPRVIGTGPAKIEEISASPVPLATVATGSDPEEKVVITVAVDLDDVTLGYGNVVSFKGGGKYRVPRWIAEHLEERGLVWSRH